MGDTRYDTAYEKVVHAQDRQAVIHRLSNDELVEALAAASRRQEPYLANVLATAVHNRLRRASAIFRAVFAGAALAIAARTLMSAYFAAHPEQWEDVVQFGAGLLVTLLGLVLGVALYLWETRYAQGRAQRCQTRQRGRST